MLIEVTTFTLISVETPFIEEVNVSVTLMVCIPAVSSLALKVPVPLLSLLWDGRTALLSVLVK